MITLIHTLKVESGLTEKILQRAEEIDINMTEPDELFEVPAYLNMLCVILYKQLSPMRTKCAAMEAIIERIIRSRSN